MLPRIIVAATPKSPIRDQLCSEIFYRCSLSIFCQAMELQLPDIIFHDAIAYKVLENSLGVEDLLVRTIGVVKVAHDASTPRDSPCLRKKSAN